MLSFKYSLHRPINVIARLELSQGIKIKAQAVAIPDVIGIPLQNAFSNKMIVFLKGLRLSHRFYT